MVYPRNCSQAQGIALLEDMSKTLDWKGKGININGNYISHLRFADDIVLMAASRRIDLGMNLDKTKVMINGHIDPRPVVVHGHLLEFVSEYTYLGHILQLGKNNFEKEARGGSSCAGQRLGNYVESSRHPYRNA